MSHPLSARSAIHFSYLAHFLSFMYRRRHDAINRQHGRVVYADSHKMNAARLSTSCARHRHFMTSLYNRVISRETKCVTTTRRSRHSLHQSRDTRSVTSLRVQNRPNCRRNKSTAHLCPLSCLKLRPFDRGLKKCFKL